MATFAATLDAALALRWVDLLLVILAAEGLALALWSRRHGLAPALPWHLASGAGLALALRGALAGSTTAEFALWLALAGACHATALWRTRWRARVRPDAAADAAAATRR
jgi:hypothetical protein